ncbi:MAG: cephalosporin hydroxylase family protein [Verrucomicrobiae bacterium]|nr:cephalosporin hydroxylase family protein [Verrucomicrobiae bacterium]
MNLTWRIKGLVHRVLRLLAPKYQYSEALQGTIAEQFHKLLYDLGAEGKTWTDTKWLGVRIGKIPFDLWVYQEILFETKPDIVIECGTGFGGSAYYLACIMDLLGKGRVVTIDVVEHPNRPQHSRIEYLTGSSTSAYIVEEVKKRIPTNSSAMVILDSDHSAPHVLRELNIYSRFVSKGNYLIVEDTNVNGHPVFPLHGPGPMEAVKEFLRTTSEFKVDKTREKYLVTFNPNGFLLRV